jgi:hypothetical protein
MIAGGNHTIIQSRIARSAQTNAAAPFPGAAARYSRNWNLFNILILAIRTK